MFENKIGVEAEFFLINEEGEAVVPSIRFDRDDFPLLGEIRGEPGKDVSSTYSNFIKRMLEVKEVVRKGGKEEYLSFQNSKRIRLDTYREALREATYQKKDIDIVKNIYGVNINDFSDQIMGKNGRGYNKIQGITSSCGLHIHFSSEVIDKKGVNVPQYESVELPISISAGGGLNTSIRLYKDMGYKEEKSMIVRASRITQPVIERIVKKMDEKFFEELAPKKKERTKYRQPGFYELKPYGFEYRSLPSNEKAIDALPEIIAFAFSLLEELSPK